MVKGPLGLDEDLLVQCVGCGLCLPHCPTYRATEEESASPRGRITLMRAVEQQGLAIDDDVVGFMERCVQCRACETACPSGVQFGRLMEQTRVALADDGRTAPRWLRLVLAPLGRHRLLLAGSSLLGLAQRARVLPRALSRRAGIPERIPVRREPLTSDADPDAWLFTGCVMDAWQRDVHAAALRVMRATGARIGLPAAGPGRTAAGPCTATPGSPPMRSASPGAWWRRSPAPARSSWTRPDAAPR